MRPNEAKDGPAEENGGRKRERDGEIEAREVGEREA